MSGGTTIYAALSGHAALTALVGDRIYPIAVPNGKAFPAVAYRRAATEYFPTIHGGAPDSKPAYDIVCGADSAIDAEAVADVVEAIPDLLPINRTDEYDPETNIYASVVTVEVLAT